MWLLLTVSALAGDVVLDLKVPSRVLIDGHPVAEVFRDAVLEVPVADGPHQVGVTIAGELSLVDVTVGSHPVWVLVGRTGVAVSTPTAPVVAATGEASVHFRVSGRERLLVQVDKQRVLVGPGVGVSLPLPAGDHEMSVRNPDGTQVFARGTLTVNGAGEAVVQLAEGRLPETSGDAVSFVAGGG